MASLERIANSLYRCLDGCCAYALVSGKQALLIDPGDGAIVEALRAIGIDRVEWVLHTHAHRDLCGADRALVAAGARLAAPQGTRALFEQAEAGWQRRQTYFLFSYGEKLNVPLRDVPVTRELSDGERFVWRDWELQVVATPGHTEYGVSLVVERDNQRMAFIGDLMAGEGTVWEFDALQSSYEEFIQGPELRRIPDLCASLRRLAAWNLDLLLPAHGAPINRTKEALQLLQTRLNALVDTAKSTRYFAQSAASLPEVIPLHTCAIQYLVPDGKGAAVMVDAGFYDWDNGRVNLFHLLQQTPVKRIPIIIPTHIHSDHVALCRAMRRRYGSKVYAHQCIADVLARPERYCVPCLCNQPIQVDRVFRDAQSFSWGGMRFTMYHFPGHTWWHQLTLLEAHGKRIAFTGDTIDDFTHVRSIDTFNLNLIGPGIGAHRCVDLLERLKPDYLCTGHWGIHAWKTDYIAPMRAWVTRWQEQLRELSERDDPNWAYDVRWADLLPFRSVAHAGDVITMDAVLRRPVLRDGRLDVRLDLPDGWTAIPVVQRLSFGDPQRHARFRITVPAEAAARRYMVGVHVHVDGESMGVMGLGCIDVGQDWSVENRDASIVPNVSTPDYGLNA